MKKQIRKLPTFLANKWVIRALICLLVAAIAAPMGFVLAKYIATENAKGSITPALFYTNGEYIQKIDSENDTVPEIKASGWKDGIVLKLYNYENDNEVSEIDLTYSVQLSEGWSYETTLETLVANQKAAATITLVPPTTAKKGDAVSFELKTAPYEITMQATFILADSNTPDWKIEDRGAYTLLTVYTNDYEGDITVQYDQNIFAPDSTNAFMADWTRNGTGTVKKNTFDRFTTYEFRFFEEEADEYQFNPSSGSGSSITITVAP